ncbi:glycoside hydrolase family 3 N-terminal domain-containing protein [Dysgonomonas sp. HGC4]|uniref:glycoside hydrolase family 3 N-terminal domain-containing protein n=1 Tax=Dysgonomonas sp. HGC4 TaxID=1658009 RepID=UPI00067FAF2C|nr:glycoside hydrolase family 3 N-terminal domain-containing protein [Dysgonomonas sp. HGC4]MBD8347872.1 glycoside hydrolase family 3 C-terminal domain-containing protein [Dysgonomonas sp. HGC4]
MKAIVIALCLILSQLSWGQQTRISSVSTSVNTNTVANIFDNDLKTGWNLSSKDLAANQWLMLTLQTSGDIKEFIIQSEGISATDLQKALTVYVTYDPMNLGEPVKYTVKEKNKNLTISFPPKYGAHLNMDIRGGIIIKSVSIKEVSVFLAESANKADNGQVGNKRYMNPNLPLEERVESLLSVMTIADKMELLREGWGIPGIPRLGIPDMKKVEALHGFSYGSGATIFPQSIGLGATWNRKLMEEVARAIGDETVSANAIQAWSPVLDVAQDARWGRCEETYGEDPVLVSEMGGAWIKGFQAKGLLTTPKHFGGHGAPLGGRDSHDIGLSEREFREIHLVPFRDVIKKYNCQSIMMAYSDYQGIPIAKSKELLKGILRDEWGFDGFIVSDCGALGNLTSRKHYTAIDKVEAARQALAAGIATNCGDTYNDKAVIAAAENGEISIEDIDFTCKTLLRTMFRNGLFENNPSKSLDWKKVYDGWNSPEHRVIARRSAQESIVLLENKNNILPLSKSLKSIAVIGPGADDLQPGDYTGKPLEGQLKSVLTGIKGAINSQTKVIYEKGCDFFYTENTQIERAVKAAHQAEVVIMVLGDCTSSESLQNIQKTSGENHDLATLILPGDQQKLLEAVCATGKPVILVLQSGRPYNLSFAALHCQGILANWLPGQEGGYATADVIFGDYNPAGRLPMTFPTHVGQEPLYYNFKTSGRRYEYSDLEYYPLYYFGFGLSYTTFNYSDLKIALLNNGNVSVQAKVTNIGKIAGDEVAQLYVTDMYASVKTRVMELKDFERIHLNPGESKVVSFMLTPYQLSLLNDLMDRVVEEGEFKIMVGGSSPSYLANDRIKDSVGYKDSNLGISGTINYTKSFAAKFTVELSGIQNNLLDNTKTVTILVKNIGNMTDAGKVSMYVDDELVGDARHFELDPGLEKYITFKISRSDYKDFQFVTKYSIAKASNK